MNSDLTLDELYEFQDDASLLKDWFIPKPLQVEVPRTDANPGYRVLCGIYAAEGYQGGAPAGGSDGSWIPAQSADVTGMTSSGITPTDRLCAND
eukprot:3109477-Pyramimonas_sp.AAC.1